MRRFRLSARLPKFEMGAELAKGIRLFDGDAKIVIREGQNVGGDFIFNAQFNLEHGKIRYKDLQKMFRNSVERVGGVLLD
jgi:hypothetical protein